MITFEQTNLEQFSFGDNPDDRFYLLINTVINPNGIDVNKLKLTNPRSFDAVLNDMGCILMLTGNEIDELISRGDVDENDLHQSLFEVAKKEGILK